LVSVSSNYSVAVLAGVIPYILDVLAPTSEEQYSMLLSFDPASNKLAQLKGYGATPVTITTTTTTTTTTVTTTTTTTTATTATTTITTTTTTTTTTTATTPVSSTITIGNVTIRVPEEFAKFVEKVKTGEVKVTIYFGHALNPEERDSFIKVINAFKQEYPGIDVVEKRYGGMGETSKRGHSRCHASISAKGKPCWPGSRCI